MIEMLLSRVVLHDARDHNLIYLREKDGERSFPIVIGAFEAHEIWRQVERDPTPRPMTHELLGNILTQLGGLLQRIVVNDLKMQTFFARLIVERGAEEIEIDARPSDAIALATRFRAPIFVEEDVLEEVASP